MIKKRCTQVLLLSVITGSFMRSDQQFVEHIVDKVEPIIKVLEASQIVAETTDNPDVKIAIAAAQEQVEVLLEQAVAESIHMLENANQGIVPAKATAIRSALASKGKPLAQKLQDRLAQRVGESGGRVIDTAVGSAESAIDASLSTLEGRVSGFRRKANNDDVLTFANGEYQAWDAQNHELRPVRQVGTQFFFVEDTRLANAYRLLGLERGVTEDALNKQFRLLSLTKHPDKGGKVADFVALSAAKDLIKQDIDRRKAQSKVTESDALVLLGFASRVGATIRTKKHVQEITKESLMENFVIAINNVRNDSKLKQAEKRKKEEALKQAYVVLYEAIAKEDQSVIIPTSPSVSRITWR